MLPQRLVLARSSIGCCAQLRRMPFLKSLAVTQWLVPLGSSLSKSLELEPVVCRRVGQSEACVVNRLTGILCELHTFEEKLAGEFCSR